MAFDRRVLLRTFVLGATGLFAACDDPTTPDATAPRVEIRSPASDTVVAAEVFFLTAVLTDDEQVVAAAVQVGDRAEQPVSITPGATVELSAEVQLPPGESRVLVHARDRAGNRGSAEVRVASDAAPPAVRVTSPEDGTVVTDRTVTFRGILSDDAGVVAASYRVNNGPEQAIPITPGSEVPFQVAVELPGGESVVQISARDRVGNTQAAAVKVNRVARFASISAGHGSTCALDSEGAAYCWGFVYGGSTFRPVPLPVSGGHKFQSLSNGGSHACGVTLEGAAYCWGWNAQGQLGNGTTEAISTRLTPVPVASEQVFRSVSASAMHSCALTDTGAAYCWGQNHSGQLGNGTQEDSNVPVPVVGEKVFRAIDAGRSYTCALDTVGAAYCWGGGGPALGVEGSSGPVLEPAPVVGGLTFESISAGSETTCGVTASSTAYCWNSGSGGRPEPVAGFSSFRSVSVGGVHACGVAVGDDAYCWGQNKVGQIGDGTFQDAQLPTRVVGGLSFRSVSASHVGSANSSHSCGITTEGIAYCWGANISGQLGTGSSANTPVPLPVVGP